MHSLSPLISVIVPVYNVRNHVAACLRSLRAQTLKDFEVIVIDDGATDGSAEEVIAAIDGDPRFQLISQENQGLSVARNRGLEQARGRFIAFVDSDDRVSPDYLMRMWQALETTGADWVSCGIFFCDERGSLGTHSALHDQPSLAEHRGLRRYDLTDWRDVIRHFPSAWNKLYRRSLIEGLRFPEGTWFEDHGFFYRAALRADHLLHLPEALYYQTRNRGGQITGMDDDRVFEQLPVLEDMRNLLQGEKTHADEAFEQITSRLLSERSYALRQPIRRRKFARAAAEWMCAHKLAFNPEWDASIARAWALEMQGELPLSVVLLWDGKNDDALTATLDSLSRQHGIGWEILVVCSSPQVQEHAKTLCANFPALQISPKTARKNSQACNIGLAAAKGRYICFLQAGDTYADGAAHDWVETMIRHDADLGISRFHFNSPLAATKEHSGFHDGPEDPPRLTETGPMAMTPQTALELAAETSAKIFKRTFLIDQGLFFSDQRHTGWTLTLATALLAKQVVYLARPGVHVLQTSNMNSRAADSPSARQLIMSYYAWKHELPASIRRSLPPGWRDRLLARAIREQLQNAAATPFSGARLGFVSSILAWRALCFPFRATAQLDPSIGPRTARLLTPWSIVKSTATAHTSSNLYSPHPTAQKITRDDMLSFHAQSEGCFQYTAEFSYTDYANISFYDADGENILFHLSLRQNENLAVCNRRHGGQWAREIPKTVEIGRAPLKITIHFDAPQVRVMIDGKTVFHFGTRLQRRRFPNLNSIAMVDYQGGVRPLPQNSLPPALEALPQDGTPALTPQITLQAKCPNSLSNAPIWVELSTGARLPAVQQDSGDGTILQAVLPGWVWQDISASQEALTVRFSQDGMPALPAAHFTRTDICTAITNSLRYIRPKSEAFGAMQIAEHVRFASLQEKLPEDALATLHEIARFYRLEAFLFADQTAPAQSENRTPATTSQDPATESQAHILARFHRTLLEAPDTDPVELLRQLLPADPKLGLGVLLSLVDVFCREGEDFDGFHKLAAPVLLPDIVPGTDIWFNSAILPFMVRDGQYDAVRDMMWEQLSPPGDSWVITPAIAWMIRHICQDFDMPDQSREDLMYAGLGFIEQRLPLYFERSQCNELIRAAALLVKSCHRFPEYCTPEITRIILSAYGMSRVFWEQFPDLSQLPSSLRPAHRAFTDLHSYLTGAPSHTPPQPKILQALEFFAGLGMPDIDRLKREVLGPAQDWCPPETLPEAQPSLSSEATLRALAHPQPIQAGDVHKEQAAIAIRKAYHDVPTAPYYQLQRRISDQILQLSQLQDAQSLLRETRTLLSDLTLVSGARSGNLGLGLALTLLNILLTAPKAQGEDAATEMLAYLEKQRQSLSRDHSTPLPTQTPPVRTALTKLQLLDHPIAQKARDLFADDLATANKLPDLSGAPDTICASPSALFDTLVMVFSCKPYLDSRIPAMRTGWLADLDRLNIPYVVVVGDGDDSRRGDILHLNVPDDYEGLPFKTLGAIRWAYENTNFGHILKIDDDCFLNVQEFFTSLSYRKFDYYGRKLTRDQGQMDRTWHNEKSQSRRGKFELDKSPEPSSYADGGSGWTLSRDAMRAAIETASLPDGQVLVNTSFMEDKMLGDLLAQQGIHIQNEDYCTTIRRRSHGQAIPVARWVNGFDASQISQTKLTHLDGHLQQAQASALLDQPVLRPAKIWPSYQDAALGYQSNALEMISSGDRLQRAIDAPIAVVACMRNEMFMLPHFLEHYRKLGVTAFLIADNFSDDGSLEFLAKQEDVALFSVDTDYNLSRYGVAWQQSMLSEFRRGKWSLVADADELLVWQKNQTQTLPELLAAPEFETADAVRIFMLDMYPKGLLSSADFKTASPFEQAGYCDHDPFLTNWPGRGPFSNMPTWTSALRHRLISGSRPDLFVAQKIALLRYNPWMRLSAGLHFLADVQLAQRELLFAHFKYNADFRRKAETEVARRQHFNDAEEYRKYLALASEGREHIFENGLSVAWYDSPFVQERLIDSP